MSTPCTHSQYILIFRQQSGPPKVTWMLKVYANECILFSHIKIFICFQTLKGTILNYRMMMERYPNLKEGVGGSIPDCEISSLPNEKLVRWSTTSCALVLACRPSVSKKILNFKFK